jgi:bifunctional DNase/RNase
VEGLRQALAETGRPMSELIELKVEAVAIDSNNAPVVVLHDATGKRRLYIWIGPAEAMAITVEMEGQKLPRPMTHDLMRDVLSELQVRLVKVVINDMRDQTYFAHLFLKTDGVTKEIDCRPSDGIALALRFKAPIFIPDALLARIEAEREEEAERKKGTIVIDSGGTTVH